MNNNVSNFYRAATGDGSVSGHFNRVVALHNSEEWTWENLQKEVSHLPRGWYELCRLPQNYRVEFSRDYWLSKLPHNSEFQEFILLFFANIEDVGVYLTQQTFGGPFEVHMVYSLQNDEGFFSGYPPAALASVEKLAQQFGEISLPSDYLAFLQIHDGFSKSTDTGLIRSSHLPRIYRELQLALQKQNLLKTFEGMPVEPQMLIPFYESFGHNCYQCFFADWYPDHEMGNVYYDGIEHSLPDFFQNGGGSENLAFPTFLDWLLFYLKGNDEF